ncbi:terminase small subunit [Billgrantia tianxiuensis]|uniref:Terminase small subunit n=1 Tax=Billgrantia tianxiuensis TaxID=2497861 RepID=A0A6I6SMM7_9GAMM|nr:MULTISPECIES: terminase small subunit [Halomonas]MCE8034604.1 terminase small subunit [Halomonas sp. MCCC 1A11057]QHC50471.1 terminase small subunit [Halomonas tianxiuensis]
MTKTAEAVELTPKQSRFVDEYLVDQNATKAAERAGYSAKTAYSQGQRLLKNVEIRRRVDDGLLKQQERTQITSDDVLQQLGRLGFSDIRKLFTPAGQLRSVADLPDDIAAAIASIEVVTKTIPGMGDEEPEVEYIHKIKLTDKVKPLELIGKHMKMFTERHEHSAPGGGPIQHEHKVTKEEIDDFISGF